MTTKQLKKFTVRAKEWDDSPAVYNVLAHDAKHAKQIVIESYGHPSKLVKSVECTEKPAQINKNIHFHFDDRLMFNFARRITRTAGLCDSSHATALKNDIKIWLERVTTKQVDKKGYVVGYIKQAGYRFELHVTQSTPGAWKLIALIEERKGRYWIATRHAPLSIWLRTIKQAEVMNELNN